MNTTSTKNTKFKEEFTMTERKNQRMLGKITWYGGRQGDLSEGTWHGGGKEFEEKAVKKDKEK